MNRRGMTLIELLTIIPLLVAIGWISAKIFQPTLRDVPRLKKVVDEQFRAETVLARLGRDVSQTPLDTNNALDITPTRLTIRRKGLTTTYDTQPGQITCTKQRTGQATPNTTRWDIPSLNVTFAPLTAETSAKAVIVRAGLRTRQPVVVDAEDIY